MRKREEEMRDTNGNIYLILCRIKTKHLYFLLQKKPIVESYSLAYSVCAVYLDWLLGRFCTFADISKQKN